VHTHTHTVAHKGHRVQPSTIVIGPTATTASHGSVPAVSRQNRTAQIDAAVDDGEPVYVRVDVGGSRASTALVACTEDLRVAACEVYQGDEAVLRVAETLRELAQRVTLREIAYDAWRFQSEALRLERDGFVMVAFPQSHARMTVASEGLHRVVVERGLRHCGFPGLDAAVASAVARRTGRGWRLDKADRTAQIDAAVALAMAVERASARPEPVRLLGWI
jgi:hypothetical protein